MEKDGPLPYTDSKPVGAADFYFAINATFRFVFQKFGIEGVQQYWTQLGGNYFAPVSQRWNQGGFRAVADYWSAFFKAEPGADVEVSATETTVLLEVKVCPAIKHLRDHRREIFPQFCHHCYFVSEAMARPAGMTVRVEGGNGSCRQRFLRRDTNPSPQDLGKIAEATC